jgi:hypothetical protein
MRQLEPIGDIWFVIDPVQIILDDLFSGNRTGGDFLVLDALRDDGAIRRSFGAS